MYSALFMISVVFIVEISPATINILRYVSFLAIFNSLQAVIFQIVQMPNKNVNVLSLAAWSRSGIIVVTYELD